MALLVFWLHSSDFFGSFPKLIKYGVNGIVVEILLNLGTNHNLD